MSSFVWLLALVGVVFNDVYGGPAAALYAERASGAAAIC
jgi:hypothetical protein